ncbi:MAG: carboxypeptidase-like regulatory domain-containing protein, partial [Bacteroidota bacterium]
MSTLLKRLVLATIALLGPSLVAVAQGQTAPKSPKALLQGRVVDPQGRPLPGATLLWEGTSRGTSANNQGEFLLARPWGSQKLLVRFVGYQPLRKEIPLGTSG